MIHAFFCARNVVFMFIPQNITCFLQTSISTILHPTKSDLCNCTFMKVEICVFCKRVQKSTLRLCFTSNSEVVIFINFYLFDQNLKSYHFPVMKTCYNKTVCIKKISVKAFKDNVFVISKKLIKSQKQRSKKFRRREIFGWMIQNLCN